MMICIPSSITEVEKRAVRDSAEQAGAKEVYLIHEPMAAALGIGIDVEEPVGNMIIDIGGAEPPGSRWSPAGIVCDQSIRIAGDEFTADIMKPSADTIACWSVNVPPNRSKSRLAQPWKTMIIRRTISVNGRDLVTGIPKWVMVSYQEVAEAPSIKVFSKSKKPSSKHKPLELALIFTAADSTSPEEGIVTRTGQKVDQ